MIGGLVLLAVAVFGIMVLFGKAKPEGLFKFAVILIFAPVALSVGYYHALWFWRGLPLWLQILSLFLIPFLTASALRLMFPKVRWLHGLQAIIFQALIYAVTFPFRFLWRASRFFFDRERNTPRLDPYRPVVGAKPPVQNERRDAGPRGDIFD